MESVITFDNCQCCSWQVKGGPRAGKIFYGYDTDKNFYSHSNAKNLIYILWMLLSGRAIERGQGGKLSQDLYV